jgi:hypothetical protein
MIERALAPESRDNKARHFVQWPSNASRVESFHRGVVRWAKVMKSGGSSRADERTNKRASEQRNEQTNVFIVFK